MNDCSESNAQTTTAAATTDHPVIATVRNAMLSRFETAIRILATDAATDEDFLIVQNTRAALREAVKHYEALADDASLEYLQRHGSVQTDSERFYVGTKRTTRCQNTRATVEAILTVTGGDLDTLCGLLASQPLKPGGCKAVLGPEWDRHFETSEVPDVLTGKPKKEVKRVDPRYLPSGREECE